MPELPPTPSQTVGPFFGYALALEGGPELVAPGHPDAIRVHGLVLDGAGEPVVDALVELWQADHDGRVSTSLGSLDAAREAFTGFGRSETVANGEYSFTTIEPGAVGAGAPALLLTVFARGVTHHLSTRAYFPQHASANDADPILSAVPAERRDTMILSADGPFSYRLDLRLQGERETVFLAFHE